MASKICRICGEEADLSLFYKHDQTRDKHRHECKACTNAKNRDWLARNPERAKAMWTRANKKTNRKLTYETYKEKHKLRGMVNAARQRSRLLKIPFDLTEADLLRCSVCPVLGFELDWNASGLKDNSPSIDRIKPELGYVKGNVLVMSNLANRMKSNATHAQLRLFADWVYANTQLL